MQEHTNANKDQDTKGRRGNPVHLIDGARSGSASADALRDVHMSLVRAEQNLYNLVQASQANGSLGPVGYGYGIAPPFTSGIAPGFAPGFGPTATLQSPTTQGLPWVAQGTAIQTPTGIAYGLPATAWPQGAMAAGRSPIVAPGFAPAYPAAPFATTAAFASAANRVPACDVTDEGKLYVCHIDLPGLRADQVDVLCSEQAIVVSALRETETEAVAFVQSERASSAQRTVTLPQEIVPTGVKATLSNGVLTILLPKANPTEGPRRIKVQG